MIWIQVQKGLHSMAAWLRAHTQAGPYSPAYAWGVLRVQTLFWSQGLPCYPFSACCDALQCFLIQRVHLLTLQAW